MTILDETLQFIADYTDEFGYPPSRRDIIDAAGRTATSSGQKRVTRLIERGLITVTPGVPRGIRITEEGRRHLAGTVMKAETEEL